MESIGAINSARRTPRLSLDSQFWVRMACVLPFSLVAWGVFMWWVFQEAPGYASQLADKVTSWTDAVAASVATGLTRERGDADKVTSALADREIARPVVDYPQSWRWRGLSNTSWQGRFAEKTVLGQIASSSPDRLRQNRELDPFGVAKFLDHLRRSEHGRVAFVNPGSPFPITQHAAALLRGSSFPSVPHDGVVAATRSALAPALASEAHRFLATATVPLMEAGLHRDLEVDIGTMIRE